MAAEDTDEGITRGEPDDATKSRAASSDRHPSPAEPDEHELEFRHADPLDIEWRDALGGLPPGIEGGDGIHAGDASVHPFQNAMRYAGRIVRDAPRRLAGGWNHMRRRPGDSRSTPDRWNGDDQPRPLGPMAPVILVAIALIAAGPVASLADAVTVQPATVIHAGLANESHAGAALTKAGQGSEEGPLPDPPIAGGAGAVGPRTQSDPAPWPSTPAATIVGDGTDGRTFAWDHGGHAWRWDINVPADPLPGFHFDRYGRHDYGAYHLYPDDDAFVAGLALDLQQAAEAQGVDAAALALSFVQALRYRSDVETTGEDEWPRYPAQTLAADGSDCEDRVILLAGLLQALGHEAVLLMPPAHMALGIATKPAGDLEGVWHRGTFYAYAETTGTGWRIGDVPEQFEATAIDVIPLDPRPIVRHQVRTALDLAAIAVEVRTVNDGPVAAADVRIEVRVWSMGRVVDRASCAIGVILSGGHAVCAKTLKAPDTWIAPSLEVTLLVAGASVDETHVGLARPVTVVPAGLLPVS